MVRYDPSLPYGPSQPAVGSSLAAHGSNNGWFRRALASGTGRVRAQGREREVSFSGADLSEQAAVDRAYEQKYSRYPQIVRGIVGDGVYDVTLRLAPLPDPEP